MGGTREIPLWKWIGAKLSGLREPLPMGFGARVGLVCTSMILMVAGLGIVVVQARTPNSSQIAVDRMLDLYRRPATAPPAPADNPITAAKVELGKKLFFDPRLSRSGAISCASCHNPALGWQDGQAKGIGDRGSVLSRHTPTLLNVAWSEPLFWDGRADTLEQQVLGPITAPMEMNMSAEKVVALLDAIPAYRMAFAATFPARPISMETIMQALASYERTIVSGTAPFDRWVKGDGTAISAAAVRGFVIFNTKAKCASCHSGWRFTDDGFRDIGLPGDDMGRAQITPGVTILERAFKTPTLRNVAERAPYMHDGSLRTMEQVIDHYDHGFVRRASLAEEITPLGLTVQDKADLIAFIKSLSSIDAPVILPNLPPTR